MNTKKALNELIDQGTEFYITKSTEEICNEVIKGGEGSRGGKVIGHTKSGQPIYDSHHPSRKGKKFAVGDKVRMTGKHLKNTGQQVGGEGQSKWKVEGFHERNPDWVYTDEKNEEGEHRLINANNLHRVGTPDHSNK